MHQFHHHPQSKVIYFVVKKGKEGIRAKGQAELVYTKYANQQKPDFINLHRARLTADDFHEARFVMKQMEALLHRMGVNYTAEMYQKNVYHLLGIGVHYDSRTHFLSPIVSVRIQGSIRLEFALRLFGSIYNPNFHIKLEEGNVLIMTGPFRYFFRHGVKSEFVSKFQDSITAVTRGAVEEQILPGDPEPRC